MRHREVAQRLTQLGCTEIARKSKGSHRKWLNPSSQKATVVPDWGSKDLKLGTLKAVVKQLGIDWSTFENA